jgi:hypothetical protein
MSLRALVIGAASALTRTVRGTDHRRRVDVHDHGIAVLALSVHKVSRIDDADVLKARLLQRLAQLVLGQRRALILSAIALALSLGLVLCPGRCTGWPVWLPCWARAAGIPNRRAAAKLTAVSVFGILTSIWFPHANT